MTRARKIIIAVVVVLAIVVAGAICLSTFTMSGVAGSAWPEMEAGAPPPRAAPADSTATDTNAMETVKQCPDGSIVPPTMQCPGATTPLPPAADGASDNAVAPAPSPSVRQGLGAFVDPGDMDVDSWTTLEFVVGPDMKTITEETEAQPLTEPRVVYIAEMMRVTLLPDPNFEIQPQSAAIQNAGADMTATWQWKVKPLRGGRATLYAKVEVGQKRPDGSLAVAKTYTRRVAIHVKVGTWNGFLNALKNASSLGDALGTLFNSWEKTLVALAALIGAVGAVWLAIKKLKGG